MQKWIGGDVINELGLSVSKYKYREPDFLTNDGPEDISLVGYQAGLDYVGVFMLNRRWFARADLLTSFGSVDYSSQTCGTKDNEFNWYFDLRGLFGINVYFDNATFSPYAGLGFRYLYNDGRGEGINGKKGYRRESNYFYLPVGFVQEFEFGQDSSLAFSAEFDLLIAGKQKTYLSDVHPRNSDFEHHQEKGYGARASIKYRFKNWTIGPYLNYWHIDDSDSIYARDQYWKIWELKEPKNYTVEAGLRIGYRF